jgi:hypothetical protein
MRCDAIAKGAKGKEKRKRRGGHDGEAAIEKRWRRNTRKTQFAGIQTPRSCDWGTARSQG